MTDPHQAALGALSEEFTALSRQMARVASQLNELERTLPAPRPVQPPYWQPMPPAAYLPPDAYQPPPQPYVPAYVPPRTPSPPPRPTLAARISGDAERGLIGKLLAAAGVAVTLIAAVAGWLNRRPGGRTGAIALAATGIAAAYIDIIAVNTIYHWVGPALSLILAAAIGGGGLWLARRWDSEQLGLLVLVPLIVLAPIVTDGITLTLIAFMLALSAAALPVQLGKDWVWLHAARTAAASVPLLLALFINRVVTGDDPRLLGGACLVAAALAVVGALILMPWITNRVAVALITVAGVLPALSAAFAVGRVLGALLAATVAAGMLAIVLVGSRLPGVEGRVRQIWAALSAVSTVIAVTVAFDGAIGGPVLLALALVLAMAGRADLVARWAAIGFAVVGGGFFLGYAPPRALAQPTLSSTPAAVSALAASVLLIAVSVAIARSWTGDKDLDGGIRLIWAGVVAVTAYCVTAFTVTAGVLIGGLDGGFLAGQMAATIIWIAIAAALFAFALRVQRRDARTAPIAGGLALTAAATAKLFLFDLGTLDGIFRVVAFIVVGLALLGMGSGYARSLAQQDRSPQG
jgi:hypothetical protein